MQVQENHDELIEKGTAQALPCPRLSPHATTLRAAARKIYGVALTNDGAVDEAETARLRARVAAE